MGYQPEAKQYQLIFADREGLEVVARGTSLGKLMELSRMDIRVGQSDPEQAMAIFLEFDDCLMMWNVDHPALSKRNTVTDEHGVITCKKCGLEPGAPLPSDVDGMLCLEMDFIMDIILGWMSAIARVSDPKGVNSSNGGRTSLEDQMSELGKKASPLESPQPN
jgi:hypothetical protein